MITIGADPEVFLQDKVGNPISSIGKIGGTKHEPLPIKDGIFLQEDNVTVEYNIPPCSSAIEFIKYNSQALDIIAEKAKQLELEIKIQASVKMPKSELTDPRAWVFGCEPDFNVNTLEYNPKPTPNTWRAAGGHIHIGFNGTNIDKVNLAKYLDATLGAIFSLLDDDTKRKKMYGQAGSIRFKEYGIEYRTLSNYWLKHPRLMQIVYETAELAATLAESHTLQPTDWPTSARILAAINSRKLTDLYHYCLNIPRYLHLPNSLHELIKILPLITLRAKEKWSINQDFLFKLLNEAPLSKEKTNPFEVEL